MGTALFPVLPDVSNSASYRPDCSLLPLLPPRNVGFGFMQCTLATPPDAYGPAYSHTVHTRVCS